MEIMADLNDDLAVNKYISWDQVIFTYRLVSDVTVHIVTSKCYKTDKKH